MPTFGGGVWGGGATGSAQPVGVPVKPLFYMALRLAHVTKVAQIGPSPDQLSDCLQAAQLMIDQAQVKRPMIYTERITDYVLGTNETYTLGPGGSLVSTTGTSIRPVKIDRANLILNTTGTPVYIPIHVADSYEELANLALQQIPDGIVKFLYCDYANPVATLYLVPQDQGGDTLEIYDWQSLPNLQTVNDLINLPPGYQDWFVNNLAVRLASIFGEKEAMVTDDTRMEAQKATRAIQSRNMKSPRAYTDVPQSPNSGRGGTFNWLDGMQGK